MARLTVEDCLHNVENRFDLVLKASARARVLEKGADALVPWDNDKPTVVALREIADDLLDANSKPKQVVSVSVSEEIEIDEE